MSVTAFFVTRDHERSLGAALRSAAPLADELLVLDTGSKDGTVAVANEAGATVLPVEWHDDFAEPCTAAVRHATGDWLLWMNPDEELIGSDLREQRDRLNDASVFAWQVRVRQVLIEGQPNSGTEGWQQRLFRRDAEVAFRGRAHPAFHPPLEALAAVRGQVIGSLNLLIHRHAWLSTPTPDKLRFAVRLLEAELRDRPGQLGYQIELGRNLLWLNDGRGHELLGEATRLVQALSHLPAAPSPWVGQLIEYLLSVSAEQARVPVDRLFARELGLRWFPNTPPVLWAVATEWFSSGNYAAAAEVLKRLLELGRTGAFDDAGGFDPAIVGPSARLNLGLCLLHLEQWEDAKRCFNEVLDDPARRDRALQGYEMARQRIRPR
jgi:hypothetical protein